MKYWEYSDIDIMESKMYPLLPLQVFKLRYKMEQIKRKHGEKTSMLGEAIMEALMISETISREGSQLFNNGEIDGDDLHRILLAVANLFEYLNTKYGQDEKLNEEVKNMTKTLYDPAVEQRGIEKGIEQGIEKGIQRGIEKGATDKAIRVAENLLKMGLTVEQIAKVSELSIEKVLEIKNEIMN